MRLKSFVNILFVLQICLLVIIDGNKVEAQIKNDTITGTGTFQTKDK